MLTIHEHHKSINIPPFWNTDKKTKPYCLDPEHFPPMFMYIPPGQLYVHTCPTCKNKMSLSGNEITC